MITNITIIIIMMRLKCFEDSIIKKKVNKPIKKNDLIIMKQKMKNVYVERLQVMVIN